MGVKFFGQFLLEKSVITPQQLLEAVEFQESANTMFGDYAVSKGYLTKEDMAKLQAQQQQTDVMFGEIAVTLGVLNQEQVDEILMRQRNDHVYIGAALVKKGYIAPGVLVKQLTDFNEDQLVINVSPFGYPDRKGFRGIRTARYTYVRDSDGPWLLYDNQVDPYQMTNLIDVAQHAELQKKLEGVLQSKLQQTGDALLPKQHYLEEWGYTVDKWGNIPYYFKRDNPDDFKVQSPVTK